MFNFVKSYVRSDQGGSRNLFSEHKYENANKFLNVTLVSDDNKPSSAHKGSNHQKHNKRKQKRIQNLPTGAARYDPSSPEWVSVLVEQENKKKKQPQKKATAVAAKSKQKKSAVNPPPRVNNSKSKTAKKKLKI